MEKVYVVVYHDPEDGYVGMDIYTTDDNAIARFNLALSALEEEDEEIDVLETDNGDTLAYLKTQNGYEVFVRVENVQCMVSINS